MTKTIWSKLTAESKAELMAFNEEYRAFLSAAKTEREFTAKAREAAEAQGFRDIASFTAFHPGDRVYAVNRNKNIALFIIGEKPLVEGMNILGAHIDSPRIDLKPNPLYEKDGFALLDTHYYGGIKKYQWVARPMALHGVICKKDGTTVNVCIGEDPNEPVVGISDLLIHLASKQMQKSGATVVEGEALNVLAASIPSEGEDIKEPVKDAVKAYFLEKYGVEEEDFNSAEIEVVPAGPALNYGLDNSMILGYGHDDRVCAYTSMRALLDTKTPSRTSCCILVDKEEIGSVGATGMESKWFENIVGKILSRSGYTSYLDLADALSNSRMLSSDVANGMDPNYPEVCDPKNTAYFGKGPVIMKYTGARGKSGSNDATAEFFAKVRRVFSDADVEYQTCELGSVDVGGGGTIARITAELDMDCIDAGIPVHNMHAPSEVVSKADVYEAYRGYKAFLANMD